MEQSELKHRKLSFRSYYLYQYALPLCSLAWLYYITPFLIKRKYFLMAFISKCTFLCLTFRDLYQLAILDHHHHFSSLSLNGPSSIIGKLMFLYLECPLSADALSLNAFKIQLTKFSYFLQEALSDFFH